MTRSTPATAGILDRLRHRLRPGSFGRNVTLLLSGTVAAQLAAVLVLPILTRIYSPSDFGIFAIYMAIIYLLSVGICGRYDVAIVLPRTDTHGRYLLHVALAITMAVTTVLVVLSLGISWLVTPEKTQFKVIVDYAVLIPVSLAAMGFAQATVGWLTRLKNFRAILHIRFQQALLVLGFQLVFVFLPFTNGVGLILAFVLAQFVTLVHCFSLLRRSGALVGLTQFTRMHRQRLYIMARKHRELPTYSLPAGLLNSFSQQSLSLVLSVFFIPHVIGLIAIAQRTLKMPVNLVVQSVGDVFVQRLAANVANNRSNVRLMVGAMRSLLLVSVIGALPLVFFADELFAFAFGKEWGPAGHYVVLLLPVALAQFCVRGISRMYVFRKNLVGLIWQTAFMVGSVLAMLIGGLRKDPSLAIAAYSWFGAAMYFLHFALTIRYAGGNFFSLFRLKPEPAN